MLKNVVKNNSYYDSATLMLLTSKVAPSVGGSKNVAVMMATEMNKDLMRTSGLLNEVGEAASPNDLIFAVRAEDEAAADAAIAQAEELLEKKNSEKTANKEDKTYTNTEAALRDYPDVDLGVISLPGAFAHIEAKRLLNNGVNVFLFSDNVSVENEIMLKDLAVEKGLLMMGPDCGTAVINGVGLGFSNKVKRGPIGIVAASGTGLQEVMSLVSNFGSGISQALGTGGRDVKSAVGGKMMLHCLDMLENDPQTKVIAIVSKPPSPDVVAKLNERIKTMSKPVVACLLGDDEKLLRESGCDQTDTLTETALHCLKLVGIEATVPEHENLAEIIGDLKAKLTPEQKYVRGLYCGGTLSYETQLVLRPVVDAVYSNAPLTPEYKLADSQVSMGNTILDLGEDEFTVGKPHPMIQPTLRHDRLLQEALDPEVAVIALDIEIGYGSNDEAGTILADEVREAREALEAQGRTVGFFATICGTYEDYQGYDKQKAILEDAGIVVFETNEQCAKACAQVIS